ncbi:MULTISPECIES: hypothetical protein [unclassified Microcoleus]|uniref:hypothetical protein n=1 Tax=unclassified Microcoleus TaxID=2642155 RepID=UPI002FD2412D
MRARTGEGEALGHKIKGWKHELSLLGINPTSGDIVGDDLLEMYLVIFTCYTEPIAHHLHGFSEQALP